MNTALQQQRRFLSRDGQVIVWMMSNSNHPKVALTPAEFAALFGKSQTWGYRQLYAGKVKAITEYGRTLIPVSEVERILGEAGRYLGAGANVESSALIPNPKKKEKERINPWKNAVGKRRITPVANKAQRKKRRSATQMSALKSSALRKLNRRG